MANDNDVVRWDEFKYYDSRIKKYIKDKSENIIQKDSYLSFPSIGNSNILYLDTSKNIAYRWDDVNQKYYSITSDYNDIDIISGGSSNN